MRNYLQIIALGLLGAAIPLIHYSKGYFFAALVLSVIFGLSSLNLQQLKSGFKQVFTKVYFANFIPLFITLALSVVYAIDFDYSVKKLADLSIVLVVASLLAVFLTAVTKERLEITIKVMLGMVIFNLGFLCFDMFFASKEFLTAFYGEGDEGPGRVRYVSSQIAVIAPLLFGYIYQIKQRHNLAWLFFAVVFVVIVATGGRSALLSFVVGGGFMILLMSWKMLKLGMKKLLLGLTISASLLLLGISGYKIVDKISGANEFEQRMTLNGGDISVGRFQIWEFTLTESLKQPIFGVGVGGYRKLAAETETYLAARNHPHNFILEILISVGFIGLFIALVMLTLKFAEYILNIHRGSEITIFVCSAFVTFWINSLTSVSIIQTYWLALFAVVFVIGNRLIKLEQGEK